MTVTSNSKLNVVHDYENKRWEITTKNYANDAEGVTYWNNSQLRGELLDIGIWLARGSHTPVWLVKENNEKVWFKFGVIDGWKIYFYDEYPKINAIDIPKIITTLNDVKEYCLKHYSTIYDESPGPIPAHGGDDPTTDTSDTEEYWDDGYVENDNS